MCNGDKLRAVFPQIFICGRFVYRIFMGSKLCLHRLRIDKQVHISIIHGLTGTFYFNVGNHFNRPILYVRDTYDQTL